MVHISGGQSRGDAGRVQLKPKSTDGESTLNTTSAERRSLTAAESLGSGHKEEPSEDDDDEDEDDDDDDDEEDEGSTSGDDPDLSDFIVDDSASEGELRRGARRPRTPPVTRSPRRLVRRSPAKKSSLLDDNHDFSDDSDDDIRVLRPSARGGNRAPVSDSDSEGNSDGGGDGYGKENDGINGSSSYNSKEKAPKLSVTALADQLDSTLRLSPPRRHEGGSSTPPPTSLESPSRRRALNSPTRSNRALIPSSPHRQSVDAFWSQNAVNEWNDEHSPRKKVSLQDRLRRFHITPGRDQLISRPIILDSDEDEEEDDEDGKKERSDVDIDINADIDIETESDDDGFQTPPESNVPPSKTPRRSPTKAVGDDRSPAKSPAKTPASPSKRTLDQAQRKFLNGGRQQLATDFLKELLDRIEVPGQFVTGSKMRRHEDDASPQTARQFLSSCNGIELVWSRTLNRTAGCAKVTRVRLDDGSRIASRAVIELAEKVLSTEHQVCNTLAHEFCHVLTMAMYPGGGGGGKRGGSGNGGGGGNVRAHGPEFYANARRIERAFNAPKSQNTAEAAAAAAAALLPPGVDLKITTCHSYDIQYKYVWACRVCGATVGRHSKSLGDDVVHRADGGRFTQIKPVPRGGGDAGGRRSPSKAASANPSPAKSAWQEFQQKQYRVVQERLAAAAAPGAKRPQMQEVMEALSRMWKEAKLNGQARAAAATGEAASGEAGPTGDDMVTFGKTGKTESHSAVTIEISDDEVS